MMQNKEPPWIQQNDRKSMVIKCNQCVYPESSLWISTVDARNPANQLQVGSDYPIIYRVLYIPGGDFFHQQ